MRESEEVLLSLQMPHQLMIIHTLRQSNFPEGLFLRGLSHYQFIIAIVPFKCYN